MMGLGLFHTTQYLPLPGYRYSKYREPEKVSFKPLPFFKKIKSPHPSFKEGEG